MESSSRHRPTRVLSLWTLLIGSFNIAGLRPGSGYVEASDATNLSAVAGSDATMPCDTRTPSPPDVLLLVVWYKDDVPIYSYDGRIEGPKAHWSDASLNGRARWHETPHSALRLLDVVPSDRALYRCRVDFKVSPTRNYKFVLHVIELPEKPRIFDENDKEVIGVAGPYVEDTSMRLTCVVSGGKPMPRLRWWRDDAVVAKLEPADDGSTVSVLELRVPRLTREYFEAVYTCTVDNTALVPPLRVNVQIMMYLRPLAVNMIEREQPLSVGQPAELGCKAIGARPPAVITWWLDDQQMTTTRRQIDSEDRNETTSFVHWTPRLADDGHVLTCRATHEKLEHTAIEAKMILNLHYAPMVELQLGSKLNPNDIEEGDDVYFECLVRSNPPAYKVVWEHNGQVMTHNQRAGVIAGSAHLALQGVSRAQAGRYTCIASNVEGDGRAEPVNLQVIYKPMCKNHLVPIVGAAINEVTRVACEVEAFPPPKTFQWMLNNSMGTLEIEPGKYTIEGGGRSILTYKPQADADYGSLACRATNLAGQQTEPCRYTLLPAVKPDPPVNCTTFNLTENSADVRCVAGYDGGLQTTYFLEAWETNMVIANVSRVTPVWKLRGLGSGKALKLRLYARNARGRSEVTVLRVHTLSKMALHTEAKTMSNIDASWVLGIVAGAVGTLAMVAIIAMMARRRHHQPLQYEAPMQTVKAHKDGSQSSSHSPLQPDDKNPDVVPLGKDFMCSRDVERPPEPPPYGTVVTAPVGSSRSVHSLHEARTSALTPVTPASDVQSIGVLADDRRSITSGTLSRRREIVTTRTPLLANARESCV
ncbi:nephrin-like [Aricia agestis]|uniref:nephrin-like n=1 Tax=Aricia agestis TaxID=91739 RepID=UPI001C205DA9|nr:nephrin-like [Aricia agestis]